MQMQGYYRLDDNPRDHIGAIKAMLSDIIDHVRTLDSVDEPEVKNLFETTADVLQGLVVDYDNYQRKAEQVPNIAY